MSEQPPIPRTRQFAVLALPIGFHDRFPSTLQLSTSSSLVRSLPVGLESHWTTWLGSILLEELHGAGCYFVVQVSSSSEGPVPVRASQHFHIRLLIALKHPSHQRGIRLSGANDLVDPSVRHFAIVDPVTALDGAPHSRIGIAEVAEAARIADALASIEGGDRFRRLRASVRIYQEGLRAPSPQVRLHQFVRAFEAIAPLPRRMGKHDFCTHAATLLGPESSELAGLVFELRSAEEHLNLVLPQVPGATEAERILRLMKSVYQAQLLAREALRRVLLTPSLLAHFESDDGQLAFWANPDRHRLWGAPVDMDALSSDFQPGRVRVTG